MDHKKHIDEYLDKILNALRKIHPQKIIIFGSYVYGKMHEDSDIDLIIVLDTNDVPKNYEEKLKIKLEVRKLVREVNKDIAIDLIVFTLPEYDNFVRCESSFAKEILERGKVLYEKAS